ncbi:major egg antigen-like [Littorina saxatilis]|uniref:SHSP domain-containing protein n=1 Tax=Littorina saxatilis TaxID=31220 RepID=A0AAN9B3A7_9CAEN
MATRIPINKEGSGLGFEDRQKRVWEDMELDMERRRTEWEDEIEKMRKEFFVLRPEREGRGGFVGGPAPAPVGLGGIGGMGSRSRLLETASSGGDDSRGMVVKDDKGNPVFKVLFDVHDYRPEEVSVKMDTNKIMVSARHEAKQGGSSVSREFSREVKIPNDLDPLTLQCTMGPDGILAVEAPIPAPSYAAIREATTSLPVRSASPLQTSSTSSSYQKSYQSPRDPVLPTGFKPVPAPFLNSAPAPSPSASSLGSSSPRHQPQQATSSTSTAYRDSSSPIPPGFSKPSPPFQSLGNQQSAAAGHGFNSPPLRSSGSGGRIGSPVVLQEVGKFKLEIDIEDFKPEELTVKTQDKRVVICARREEKIGNRSSTRELSREHTIPETVDPISIKAFFTDGGKLIVEAPFLDAAGLPLVTGR